MNEQPIDDAEQISLLRGRQKGDHLAKIRHSALVLAEYQHHDEPKIRALSDTAGGIQRKMDGLRAETEKFQQEFIVARQKLEKELEQHIPEELRMLN